MTRQASGTVEMSVTGQVSGTVGMPVTAWKWNREGMFVRIGKEAAGVLPEEKGCRRS